MDNEREIIQETVSYEPGLQFKLHNNISTTCYSNHWHSAVEIVMPVKNAYEIEAGYQPYALGEHDIFIVPPGELHSLNMSRSEGQRIILQFGLEVLNTIAGFGNASHVYSSPLLITPETAPELHGHIKTLLLEILEEHLSRNEFFEVAITQKIIGITLLMIREKRRDAPSLSYGDLSGRSKHIERLNECLEYINRNFSERLTLEGVAQAAGYSKYHFSRWFQEYAAMPFLDYLTKIRVSRAEALLVSSGHSITEIAMESGFQSTNTFNRVFKKYNGYTPTQYRHIHYLRKQADITPGADGKQEARADAVYTMKTPVPHRVPGFSAFDAAYRADRDGAFFNPVIWADVPDPDVIRVGDVYYMTSTTMYFNPGIPVMKSYDMIHWEIVNYVYDILDSSDENALRGGAHAYGRGSWASSLRQRGGVFYVAVCSLNTEKTYIFQTGDIENGPWSRYELDGIYHDSSLLFDDDGRVYLVYGGGTIRIAELSADATAILPGGMSGVIIENADAGGEGGLPAEGSHIYKIDGKYYLFLIAWPESGTKRRVQLCYRADSVGGPYEGRVILDDDLGFENNGVAQGGIFDTPDGDWYAMLFQDHGAVGRIPVLVPVAWKDGFPVFGADGRVPDKLKVESGKRKVGYGAPIVCSDEFYARGPGKNYAAVNDNSYQYAGVSDKSDVYVTVPRAELSSKPRERGFAQGSAAPHPCSASGDNIHLTCSNISVISNLDVELLVNNRFEDGAAHWDVMEVADIGMAEENSSGGAPVLFVSGRTTTASGLRQIITGKVKAGGIYEACAHLKYTSGPPEKTFNICIRNGSTWEGIRIMGSGRLARGQWGVIRGTYTIPAGADLQESSVFIETPWSDKPKKETDLMDYYVRHVSVTEKPAVYNTAARPGENSLTGAGPAPCWQWNHNPDNNLWTLTERPGYLRLRSAYLSRGLLDALNTLTQRTFGPFCTGTVALETGGMKDGDTAGLAALQELYGYVGVKVAGGTKYIVMVNKASGPGRKEEIHPHTLAGSHAIVPISQERVYFRAEFDFVGGDSARFYYSLDEINWHAIGEPLPMEYRLSHFTGYRFALFYFATQIPGGFADFDYFRLGDAPVKDNKDLKILNASFISDTQALGIKGTKIKASICMDALPQNDYKGLYLSFAIPDILRVDDVSLHGGNITGDAGYSIDGNQLKIEVTGSPVSFAHAVSGRFADFSFVINEDVTEDIKVHLRPDYIYAAGGNAAYLTHSTYATIHIYAPDTFTRGWHE